MIKEYIANLDIKSVRTYFKETPIPAIAEELKDYDAQSILILFKMLSTEDAAELFSYFEKDFQWKLIEQFADSDNSKLIEELKSDEIADILEEMPASIAQKLLRITPKEKRKVINQLLNYKDDCVGSIMAVDIAVLKSNYTCEKALQKIKVEYDEHKSEMSHYFYVVDKDKKLLGSVTLEDIVFSDKQERLENLMFPVTKIGTMDHIEAASKIFAENDLSALPVVNVAGILVGMVTSDDIIDVINVAAIEDIYKMAGISAEDAEKPYFKKTTWEIVKSRIFWLVILMIGSTLSQIVIQIFTDKIGAQIASAGVSTAILVGMIPVISGSAGNAGSQSSTTITRAFALGEIRANQLSRIVWKEVKVSLIAGLILFIANFIRLILYFLAANKVFLEDPKTYSLISFASSLALFLVVVFSKILGTLIPIIAIKLKKDPAVLSAPLLSTLSDAIATLIFFGITMLVLFIAFA
ncbi:Magnesium transporter mgtE [Mycoplasmopsis californica]|uniref:Magnesium transporter MgtE n=1 Tax=Mycoplasmopsis equigenitalium TaxID=114883 RepID=A0ABY5J4M2_9BACT|nr:magnesium transporter [Mycoplasmopsis equigenitalium]UUD36653.1 magnesium transporter [Mycoplasmopsis equigenitalium]VEU69387.1 Magnesium transporter mgtE [Mycoplasmopsis californica]